VEDLVGGLYGQDCPWRFALAGRANDLRCWFAADRNSLDSEGLAALVRANLPDARVEAVNPDLQFLDSLRHGLILTGTPEPAGAGPTGSGDRIEKLCRGLIGANWLYLVTASPVTGIETVRAINGLSQSIRDARSTWLLKASPIDGDDRTAERYVDLLEKKLLRYERGRALGMWNVRCSFYSDVPALLPRAGTSE
jgi:hypothetical protein